MPCILFYIAGGREHLPTVPCVRFYVAEGGERLSTVPCVRFNIAKGGDDSPPSPLFSFTWHGRGDSSLTSPGFGSIQQGGDGSLLSPVFGLIKELVWCFGEGTVSESALPPCREGRSLKFPRVASSKKHFVRPCRLSIERRDRDYLSSVSCTPVNDSSSIST